MGVTGPPGPVMDRDEVDRALARLGAEHEAIETSLLALQDHAGRRLLEGAELTGVTKERWASAEASITLLWTYFDAYTDALRGARDIRSRRRWSSREDLAELTELLRGESVTVAGSAAGTAATANAPTLHGAGRLSHSFSLTTLVDRMNELYASSLDMVVTADAVWSALPARIDLLAAELQRTRALAHSVGVRPGEHPAGDDLERITHTLTSLREQVVSDPLAFWVRAQGSSAPGGGRPDTTVYDREARALEDVRREIDAVLTVRQDAEQRLVRLRDILSRADRTLAEARTARGEVLAKIAATEVPVVSGPPTVLQEQLATAAEYRRHAQWHRLSPLLESLEQKAEDELLRARESLTAVTQPLAVRAELRGRLDAYKAKVARHGLAEDPFLIERYDAARRMLWSAPCDLRVAGQAVLRYQQAAAELLTAPRVPEQGGLEDRRGSSSHESGRAGMSAAGLRGVVRGCGRRRAVLRHLRSGPGRLVRGVLLRGRAGRLTADRGDRGRQGLGGQRQFTVQRAQRPQYPYVVAVVEVAPLGVRTAVPVTLGQVDGPFGVGAQLRLDGRLLRAGPARRRPGHGAAGAATRPARDGAGEPRGAGAQAVLLALRLRCPGGPFAR